jgi:S-adenosylmethionine:tRNA ribosyltransferase-isomerase
VKTSDFDYDLPAEYIAQTPAEPRDSSRLLVLDRRSGQITHTVFHEIGRFLTPGDILVANETRVIPARLFAHKIPSGGRVEILLLRKIDALTWEALVGGKGLNVGRRLQFEEASQPSSGDVDYPTGSPDKLTPQNLLPLQAEIKSILEGPRRLVSFDQPVEPYLDRLGHVPLPPYIHTPLSNAERYQTVYNSQPGSAAAPTAGLHFTPELIESLRFQGIRFTTLTLHVGLDTFAPVNEADPQAHHIHTEWCQVSGETAEAINQARRQGGRIIAVGTTSVRTLESAAASSADPIRVPVAPFEGPTGLFILPGYNFRVVDAMITNFHLPRSTLLMLVSAFAGRELALHTYEIARQAMYRFYSFGDAMFII